MWGLDLEGNAGRVGISRSKRMRLGLVTTLSLSAAVGLATNWHDYWEIGPVFSRPAELAIQCFSEPIIALIQGRSDAKFRYH